jgi:hypothetical protein
MVALREVTLGSGRLQPHHNWAESRKLSNPLRLYRSKVSNEGDDKLMTPCDIFTKAINTLEQIMSMRADRKMYIKKLF